MFMLEPMDGLLNGTLCFPLMGESRGESRELLNG